MLLAKDQVSSRALHIHRQTSNVHHFRTGVKCTTHIHSPTYTHVYMSECVIVWV